MLLFMRNFRRIGAISTTLARGSMHTRVNMVFDAPDMLTRASSLLSMLGFECLSKAGVTSVRMQHHGLNIDLHNNASTVSIRKLIGSKRDIARVATLDFYPGLVNPSLSENGSKMGFLENLNNILSKEKAQQNFTVVSHPYCNETAPRYQSRGLQDKILSIVEPKELVIPTLSARGDNTDDILSAFADVGVVPLPGNRPGLYCSSSSEHELVLRLIPCRTLGIVLRVECLDKAEDFLISRNICFERLGNAMSGRELQIVDTALTSLDLRLSDDLEINSYWREGVADVIDHTTVSMQNSRVFAGEDAGTTSPSAQIDSRTLNGDCWMEVRAQAAAKIVTHGGGDHQK